MAKSKYFTHVEPKLKLVECWARDGLTDEQIANNLGIAYSTLGDTTAQIFWLKNRKPQQWRDKKDIEHSGEVNNPYSELTTEELKKLIQDD